MSDLFAVTWCHTLQTHYTYRPALAVGFGGSRLRVYAYCRKEFREDGREGGQAMLEMVISLMVVMALVFWLFELCLFTYTCSVLNSAAQEGVRYAILHGTDSAICSGPDSTCSDQSPYANVRAVVSSAASASLHDMTALTVSVTYTNGTADVGNPVVVQVVYTYVPIVAFTGIRNRVTFSSQGKIVF